MINKIDDYVLIDNTGFGKMVSVTDRENRSDSTFV